MANNQDIILKLIEKLEHLYKKQADFTSEIDRLKEELYRLKTSGIREKTQTSIIPESEKLTEQIETPDSEIKTPEIIEQIETPKVEIEPESIVEEIKEVTKAEKPSYSEPIRQKPPKSKSNLEKFVGENLLNKIGIVITVIGVAIGAKYSIENDLISPLTRIILGYLSAIALLGFGIRLKKNYESYSAVLVSGATVILYFITFFAYSFYDLIPQVFAFALMVLFTIFTVVAAINYNRQIISHLGLVGAYAVPFLLSNDSGRVEILFSYIAIINVGILITSFKKYWKSLYYSAFCFTWLIFSSWFIFDYETDMHFALGLSFLTLFFIIFYVTFLAYKMVKKETYGFGDIILLLANSFIFYSFGYAILSISKIGEDYLGLFTLGNAIIHFIVATLIYKQKLGDKGLFYLASGLVLVFITIAIPVQLDGNWVTLLWSALAALLFWIGRSKSVPVYEKLSYPLMFLAFFSLLQDWSMTYGSYFYSSKEIHLPLLNINFLSSILFILSIAFVVYIGQKKIYKPALNNGFWKTIMNFAIPSILLFSVYMAFRLELADYFNQLVAKSKLNFEGGILSNRTIRDYDLNDFKSIWIINYSLLFVSLLFIFNSKFIKNQTLKFVTLGLTVLSVFVFLVQGLYSISELRESYLNPSEYYNSGMFYILIRYISFLFLALGLYTCYRFIKEKSTTLGFKISYDLLLHISIVWVLSSELIHWMDMGNSEQSYKLGLSILWGVYSFLLIAFGIWKNKKYLRIGGIGLFGITLLKLFFYDIVHLNTISKTIVFVSLGILLLVISFLYNKYKHLIIDEVKA
ncbi:DUF2339 domain-containing protein [Winogradskyella litorisediminis]|uniref:DUF2339 domain-containing protein n=1 Tax=Winogradskyella litorisediminis TaxID=1156618 RepID=A0ABW3N1Y7_9FLAO